MGTVFRALDMKLDRVVAIKFLSDELADATARRRFQREAQMASSLTRELRTLGYRVELLTAPSSSPA